MSAIRKFTFDQSFGNESRAANAIAEAAARIEAEREAIQAVARAEGFEAGLAQARGERDAAIRTALTAIAGDLGHGIAQVDALRAQLAGQAVELALALAEAIAGKALAQTGLAGIEAVVADVLAEQIEAPRLTIRVGAALLDDVRERVQAEASAMHFEGRLIFQPEPGFGPGDCAIEWANGGVRHVAAERRAAIEAQVRDFLSTPMCQGEQ